MGRWLKFERFTIQGDRFLEVSRSSCALITVSECFAKIPE
jgi:hypothetical protein